MKKYIITLLIMLSVVCGYSQSFNPILPSVVSEAVLIDSLHYNTLAHKDITVDIYMSDMPSSDLGEKTYLECINQGLIAATIDSIKAEGADYYYIRSITFYNHKKEKMLSVRASDLPRILDGFKDISKESLIRVVEATKNYIKW